MPLAQQPRPRCLHCGSPPRRSLDDGYAADPYRLLGIAPTDDVSEIKRAFRDKALGLHPDRVAGGEAEQAVALEKFNEVVEAFERLTRAEGDWRFRQESDFAQWLRDELEWARAKLRSQRGRVLTASGSGAEADSPAASELRTHMIPVKLRPEQREEAEQKVAARRREQARSARVARVEELEAQQEIEAELGWAMAKVAADRQKEGRPSEKEQLVRSFSVSFRLANAKGMCT